MQDIARLVRRGRRESERFHDAAHPADLLGVAAGELAFTDPQAVFQPTRTWAPMAAAMAAIGICMRPAPSTDQR